jgi:hypothetical protein
LEESIPGVMLRRRDGCVGGSGRSACAFNALVAYVALRLRPQDNTAYVPQYNFMLVSLSYVGAMYGSSTALKFVSFPTQVRGPLHR